MLTRAELEPGQKVSQTKLARQLGCSTVPVVEAMRRLESEGLLVKDGRRMARVRQLSRRDREGLYLVREGLEGVAARLCAERITDSQIEELRELGRQYEEATVAGDTPHSDPTDIRIHHLIVRCAQCPLLEQEISRLLLIERTAGAGLHPSEHTEESRTSHRALIQALADRDADSAEYLMKRHIQRGTRDLRRAMAPETDT